MKFSPAPFLLPIALAALACTVPLAAQQVISLNIVDSTSSDPQNITGAETFGFGVFAGVNTTVGNWTNTTGTVSNLPWNDASGSSVGVTLQQPNGRALFNSAIFANSPLAAGIDDYSATTNAVSVTFSNLNANFPNGYIALVYATGFATLTNASISNGSTTYWYRMPNPIASLTLTQMTQTTDLGAGNNPIANVAVFGSTSNPLNTDTAVFRVDNTVGGGAGIGGVQLIAVPVPEPAIIALGFGLVAVGATYLRRRRRL